MIYYKHNNEKPRNKNKDKPGQDRHTKIIRLRRTDR